MLVNKSATGIHSRDSTRNEKKKDSFRCQLWNDRRLRMVSFLGGVTLLSSVMGYTEECKNMIRIQWPAVSVTLLKAMIGLSMKTQSESGKPFSHQVVNCLGPAKEQRTWNLVGRLTGGIPSPELEREFVFFSARQSF